MAEIEINSTLMGDNGSEVTYNVMNGSGGQSFQEPYAEVIMTSLLCGVGVVGNISNLAILRLKKTQVGLDHVGKAAIYGLIALGWSDMFFCLIGVPSGLILAISKPDASDGMSGRVLGIIGLVYRHYKGPCLNLFLFTSTWFIVLLSTERYLAVCHPFRCRQFIHFRWVVLSRLLVAAVSILINMPLFFRYALQSNPDVTNSTVTFLYMQPTAHAAMPTLMEIHSLAWTIIGTFLPMALLIFSNWCLAFEIRRVSQRCELEKNKADNFRVSSTLLAIAAAFVVLVTPSMILNFLGIYRLVPNDAAFSIAVRVTNLAQVVKFSCNFVLYCGINKPFRDNLC